MAHQKDQNELDILTKAGGRNDEERELLDLLARAERDIAADKGIGLDEVLAEADALLAGKTTSRKSAKARR